MSREFRVSSRIFRHDAITLHSGAKEEDFEDFMKEELIPFFSETYRGPTRTTNAYLISQSLLKDTKGSREWLWVTAWESGNPEDVRGSYFEHTRIGDEIREDTQAMLKKLDYFGERTTEDVFSELDSNEVATNP
jgi:hypothetical protein